jgi:membrane-associated phospholipid phosphatase
MAYFTVQPTRVDEEVARFVATRTDEPIEGAARMTTWAADEHVMVVAAVAGWLLTRRSSDDVRRLGTHFLVSSLATALLPHIMKKAIDQKRPDRLTLEGHLRGVPLSGRANDAFPSGHAMHLGALASAATLLRPAWRNAIWIASGIVASTRVVLLAHWLTDVVAGIGLGAVMERGIRHLTKLAKSPSSEVTLAARREKPRRRRPRLSFSDRVVGRRGPTRQQTTGEDVPG